MDFYAFTQMRKSAGMECEFVRRWFSEVCRCFGHMEIPLVVVNGSLS